MNKAELRDSYVAKGWEVQPVADWRQVSSVEGKVKYDVNVVSPKEDFATAQVVVVDDGGAGETAVADGVWKDKEPTFDTRLRDHLATLEAGPVFAVAVVETYGADSVAECKAYMNDGSVKDYVVKERNDTFDHKELI
jgi:hypothetical protein